MSDPTPNPQWSSDYFRDVPAASGARRLGRGMVGHVPIVATLMLVQGALEVLMGVLSLLLIAVTHAMPKEGGDLRPLVPLIVVASASGFVCGALHLLAGFFNFRFRRRILGVTALGVGLLSVMNLYCAPTAIALAVYGLIVYLNDSVVAAFEMGTEGKRPADIHAAFPPG